MVVVMEKRARVNLLMLLSLSIIRNGPVAVHDFEEWREEQPGRERMDLR